MSTLSQSANGLLTQLVMELKSGYIRRCEALGVTTEEMKLLQGLTLEDLHYLSESRVCVLTFSIHHENLKRLLAQARLEQQRMKRIDRSLELGASIEMMQHFFGLGSFDVATRRRIAGIHARTGRTSTLSDKENLKLWQYWQTLSLIDLNSAESLDIMITAAEQFDIPLTRIWHAFRDWQATQQSARTDKPVVLSRRLS